MPSREAAVQNAVYDAARANMRTDRSEDSLLSDLLSDEIWLSNSTGSTIERWTVSGIGDPIFDPSSSENAETTLLFSLAFAAVFPPQNLHRGRFVVAVEPIPDGGVGRAKISNVAYVLVADDVETGDWVDIDESSRASEGILEWFPFGSAQVLWCGAITSTLPANTKLALVKLTNTPGPTKLQGQLAEDLDAAADSILTPEYADVTLFLGDPAALSTRTITVTNRSIDATAEAGTYVGLTYDAHLREVVFDWIDCTPDEISGSSNSGGTAAPGTGGGTVFGGPVYGGP